ncbi:MAG: type VI secretion system contractile sheath large subunit, partial [Alphaproteobacteria bacterium]|nr:type VI secretion system contractile sheath large subunit [Alphaproteobacteria bacterium]
MANGKGSGSGKGAAAGSASVLSQIISKGKLARDPSQESYAKDLVQEFVDQVLAQGGAVSNDTVSFINERIQQIDTLLSAQLDEILHAPEFQKLEGSWRGLNYLVKNTETGTMIKIRVFNISKAELLQDLERAVEFDQSALFKKVYEEEYGTYGGSPYSCLIGDYEFSHLPQDVELLEKISGVAAAAHAPFLTAADASLFDLDSFTSLGAPRDLAMIFDSVEYAKWNSFREMEDSRYVVLTMPRVLMRLPYGSKTVPVDGINYEEQVNGTDNTKFCWGNTAYAFGQRVTNAFFLYQWTAAIR